MKKFFFSFLFVLFSLASFSQCAMCTKTASTLDDKSAKGLNTGIVYLAFMPLTFIIIIGIRWYKSQQDVSN
jgi:hypothetical protein